MRNLKRALSLALALVMVLSMMVVGAGAVSIDDFSDADQIVNQEAVTVLATLNVITGKDDGTYDPTGTVTRAEMAKMICVILNGGSDPVLGESVTDSYTDTSSHWAKAYIEYCTTLGIVSGKGDGTFDPDGEVTVAEAAKMVLVALGYNASIESYTGANWQINVDARANPLGLYDDMSYSNTSAALTRDNAAQMLYNALDCDMVEYEYVLDTTSSTITGSTQLKSDSTLGTLLEEKFNAVKVEGIVVANEVANLTSSGHLNEERTRILVTNYDDQLYYGNEDQTRTVDFAVTTGLDELGRSVSIYVDKESTSTNATVLGSVILSEDNTVVTDYTDDPFEDIADDNNLDLITSGSDRTQIATNYGDAEDLSSSEIDDDNVRGTEKIFIDNDGDSEVDYLIVNTYRFGKVTSYVSSGDGSIVVNYGTEGTFTMDAEDVVGFEDVSRDDYVVAIDIGGRLYVEMADTLTGVMEGYREDTDSPYYVNRLTVDGEDYEVSAVSGYKGGSDDIKAGRDYGETYLDNEATFYLTAGGYIAAVGESDASAYSYALVLATGATGLEDRVRVALSDGTTGTYDVSSNSSIGADDAEIGTVYRYSISSSGDIRLSEAYGPEELTDVSFTSGRTTIRDDDDSYYATSSTAFFYVGLTDDEWDDAVAMDDDTDRISTDDVDLYTGYSSAPDLDSSETLYAMVYTRTEDGTQAGAVVFYGSADLSSADVDDSMYITSVVRTTTDYVVVNAFLAGEPELQQVQVDIGDRDIVAARGAYTYTINSDGYYELTEIENVGNYSSGTVDSASSSTFILDAEDADGNDEYEITSETLLVDHSTYLDDPTGELGAGPYEDDNVLWVIYNSDFEAILVVVRNSSSSSGGGTDTGSSDSTPGSNNSTLYVDSDEVDVSANSVSLTTGGTLSYYFNIDDADFEEGDTVSYDWELYIEGELYDDGVEEDVEISSSGRVGGRITDVDFDADNDDEVELYVFNIVVNQTEDPDTDETYALTLATDLGTNVRVWIDDGNTRIETASSTARGDVYNVPQNEEVLITGVDTTGLTTGDVFEQDGVVFTVTSEGITFTMSGAITLSSIPSSESYSVTVDGEVVCYITDDNATITGLTPNGTYLIEEHYPTRSTPSITADGDGEATVGTPRDLVLYTAYEVELDADIDDAVLSDGETDPEAYVAAGETITFTLDGGYSINGEGDDYNNEKVTLTVDEDITVEKWESEETFQETVEEAVSSIGTKDDLSEDVTITETASGWSIVFNAEPAAGMNTGAMDALNALIEAGYSISVRLPSGMVYTVDPNNSNLLNDVLSRLPENGENGTYTLIIDNGMDYDPIEYTIDISVSYTED